jgi:hypothetical protein
MFRRSTAGSPTAAVEVINRGYSAEKGAWKEASARL